jgi:hypothetical protein
MNNRTIGILIALLVVFGLGGIVYVSKQVASAPGEYDGFAQCLADKGAKFYGAFWCPHCAEQKTYFGRSAKKLPYVECSTPDGRGQTEECTSLGIASYPTWEFATGTRVTGKLSLEQLAERTSCPLVKDAVQ